MKRILFRHFQSFCEQVSSPTVVILSMIDTLRSKDAPNDFFRKLSNSYLTEFREWG